MSVAGRDQPVVTYEVVRDAVANTEIAAPFVGRAVEMRRLRAVFDTARTTRTAQLVTVLGSPGVGKTRLSRELCVAVESDAIDQWAFCSLRNSPGARAYYDHRRALGDSHHQALRALGNRLVGILHGCLRTHTTYNEHLAWAHRNQENQIAA